MDFFITVIPDLPQILAIFADVFIDPNASLFQSTEISPVAAIQISFHFIFSLPLS